MHHFFPTFCQLKIKSYFLVGVLGNNYYFGTVDIRSTVVKNDVFSKCVNS